MSGLLQTAILLRRLGRRSATHMTHRLLGLCIVICTMVAAALGFFASSVQTALDDDIATYLGAPFVVRSEQVLPLEQLGDIALTNRVTTSSFTTGAVSASEYQSISLKGVSDNYPLQGQLLIRDAAMEFTAAAHQLEMGQAWVEQRVLDELSVQIGDQVQVGRSWLTISGVLVHEPDRLTQLQHALPRVLVNHKTLLQTGVSVNNDRGEHRILVDGPKRALADLEQHLALTVSQTYEVLRPDKGQHPFSRISQRAERLLNLILVLILLLCGSAAATLTDHSVRHYISAATILRCMGVNRKSITWALCLQLLALALVMSMVGCLLGWLVQPLLISVMQPHMTLAVTSISVAHLLGTIAIGLITVMVFVLPKLNALSMLPIVDALRDQTNPPTTSYFTALLASVSVIAVLWLTSDNLELTGLLVAAVTILVVLSVGIGWGLSKLAAQAHRLLRGPTRVSVRSIGRSPGRHLTPITSTSIVMLAVLMTVTLRGSFLDVLQIQMLETDGNYIFSGLPADQSHEFTQLTQSLGAEVKAMHPTISSRLVSINGVALDDALARESDTREETRSKVRLSRAEQLPANNKLRQGHWPQTGTNDVSVDYEVMSDLDLSLGDKLGFKIGDQILESTITSQHEYRSGGSRITFWFVFAGDALAEFEQRNLGGILIEDADSALLARIARDFPEVRITDIERQISGIRDILIVLTRVMNTVLLLLLTGAVMVIVATSYVSASNQQRLGTLLRVLGLRRSQIIAMNITEHLVIALVACLVGVIGVQLIAGWMFQSLFALSYQFEWTTAALTALLICLLFSMLGIVFARRQWRQSVILS